MVKIDITGTTLSALIGGLYSSHRDVNVEAIPQFFWLQLAYSLEPYLENWRYDIQSLEDWITTNLFITVAEICTEKDIQKFRENTIFIQADCGNVSLIATGDILWENYSETSKEKENYS